MMGAGWCGAAPPMARGLNLVTGAEAPPSFWWALLLVGPFLNHPFPAAGGGRFLHWSSDYDLERRWRFTLM